MTVKETIFSVIDVETCKPHTKQAHGLVFDMGWQHIDRKNRVYGAGSYLAKDVLSLYRPYFHEKVGRYFELAFEQRIKPLFFWEIAMIYGLQIQKLQEAGHRVICCAYNAGFDFSVLSATSKEVGMPKFILSPVELMCIWHYWALSCPLHYTAKLTASKKYLSTTAEDVYRFEFQKPNFVEDHTGFADVTVESRILLKTVRRKKPMPIVNNVNKLPGNVWFIANQRLGHA